MANQVESPLNFSTYIRSTTINAHLSTNTDRVVDITTKQGSHHQLTIAVHEALGTEDTDQVLLKMGTSRDPLRDMSTVAGQISTLITQYQQAFSDSRYYNEMLAGFARLVASCDRKLKDAGDSDLIRVLQLSVLLAATGQGADQATNDHIESLHQSKKALVASAVDDFRGAAIGLCGFVSETSKEETVVPAERLAIDLAAIVRGGLLFQLWAKAFEDHLFM